MFQKLCCKLAQSTRYMKSAHPVESYLSMIALLAVLLSVTNCSSSKSTDLAQTTQWDMPLAYSETNYHSANATNFAAAVTQATEGALTLVTHPNGSLYKGDEIFEAVQTGKVFIGERLISALSEKDPIFEIDALPFLATSFEDAKKLYKASKPVMEDVLDGKGLKLLYAVPWPPQGLYSTQAVNSSADMQGVKFRAYNAITSRLAELMGAIPTEIEAADISEAFAAGRVESMISSSSTGYDRQIWEHVNHWYDIQAWIPKNMVFVNKEAWSQLDSKTQHIILGAAAMAEQAGWRMAQRLADWYKAQLSANGMQVSEPSDSLKEDFKDIGETLTTEWLEKDGDKGQSVIDTYKSL